MTRFSLQATDRIFITGYGFLSFGKNVGKNVSKNLSGKYSQKLLDMLNILLQMRLKFFQKKTI